MPVYSAGIMKEDKKSLSCYPFILCGDLIDRGNFSFEVLEYVKNEGIKFTPGNHDYMFYYFIKKPTTNMGASWIYNGFEKTISSYDNKFDKISEHLDLITQAPLFFNLPECFISHAGISGHLQFYHLALIL